MALFREVEDSSQTIMIGSWILELLLSDLDFIKDKSQLLQAEQTGDGKTSSPLSKEISGILDSIKSLMKTYKVKYCAKILTFSNYSLMIESSTYTYCLLSTEAAWSTRAATSICRAHW